MLSFVRMFGLFFRNGALLASYNYAQSLLFFNSFVQHILRKGVKVRTHLSVKADVFVS